VEIGHVCLLCVFCSLLSTLGEGPKRNGITGKGRMGGPSARAVH